jgi:hypothetical protein
MSPQPILSQFLKTTILSGNVPFETIETAQIPNAIQKKIIYQSQDGDPIPPFLWIPEGAEPFPAILVHHQHNSERHFGKSEVAGLVGDPLQAFGPVLA